MHFVETSDKYVAAVVKFDWRNVDPQSCALCGLSYISARPPHTKKKLQAKLAVQ
jgi:hypothetical protein